MNKLNDIITSAKLPSVIKVEANYPGHVDLDIDPEYRNNGDFIVMTAEAAELLMLQLETIIKQARRMAEQQPLFKED